ncbi:MAG: hypothetical protein ABW101_06165 [Candidatus Thiodiazotropha sp.]
MKLIKRTAPLAGLCGLLFALQAVAASGPVWLSDHAPKGNRGMRSSHGGPVEIRRGTYYKHLWIRQGDSPQTSNYARSWEGSANLQLLDAQGQLSEIPLQAQQDQGGVEAVFPMPDEGFYNAYLQQARIEDGRREMTIAKTEVLKHSCREGHDNVQEKMPAHHNPAMPLEIVRERQEKENFHTLTGYGDEIRFRILSNGEPLAGAKVTITSGQGWSKSTRSNDQGLAAFTMIRDYYPDWTKFEKRHAQTYLVNAVYESADAGEWDGVSYRGTRYLASFTGQYFPSEADYESYAHGLSYGLGALFLTAGGTYFYRRRRIRPYREIRFDE